MKGPIELLSPARNEEFGRAAIDHGADAVYIGAPAWGARAAATNSVADIERLAHYAHRWGARVYVAMNTIIYDAELADARHLAWQLYDAGVDALIIQDMGLLEAGLPPLPLHASTQTDNRTAEKVKFLADAGFSRVILARELTLDNIYDIHQTTPVELEAFVHGALCTGYSGQCYASRFCSGRSANRGECAQFCRLPFALEDAHGQRLGDVKHHLSLRDMNRLARLGDMLDAGISSFKIEGRLKDLSYVKNITACYRQALDAELKRRPALWRASQGHETYRFKPQADRSFNRGFTEYFLSGRTGDEPNPHTPKSMGEHIGRAKEVRKGRLTIAGIKPVHNGDGLCFLNTAGRLEGFRVNRVEGNHIYPQTMPVIDRGTPVYRNYDHEFESLLARADSATRLLPVRMHLWDVPFGFALEATDGDHTVTVTLPADKTPANKPQDEQMRTVLAKTGGTGMEVEAVRLTLTGNYFIPASALTALRRTAVEKLWQARLVAHRRELKAHRPTAHPYPEQRLTYLGNVANAAARTFYQRHGVSSVDDALETSTTRPDVLMFSRHCIRHAMGWCPVHQRPKDAPAEPLRLVDTDGRKFKLQFDCKQCIMKVVTEPH